MQAEQDRRVDCATGEVTTVEVMPDVLPGTVMLEALREGQCVEEIAEHLREMAQLVLIHQKKGKVTVSFIIEPLPGRQVIISDDINDTPPRAALPQTIRFVDSVGNFKTSDPEAGDLMSNLRQLEADRREIRKVEGNDF